MKSFRYIARDGSGIRREGLTKADSPTDVLTVLRERGFIPILVQEITAQLGRKRVRRRRKRIKSSDLAAVCWQLGTLLEGGVPITEAINVVAEDCENYRLKTILEQILRKIRQGETFSSGLSEFPGVFSNLSRAIVVAGETSGNLPHSLQTLAEHFETRDKLKKKIQSTMAYPLFVVIFVILIVIFMITMIIPKFEIMFANFGGTLPAFTRGFMAVYYALRNNWLYIIGMVGMLVVSGVLFFRTVKGHYFFSRLVLRLPVIGSIIRQTFVHVFCKAMGTLLASGVSMLEVFDILSTMTKNDVMRDAVLRARGYIVEGSSISLSMAGAKFFPGMVVKMTQVGEESGCLPKVLQQTAAYYERKVDTAITTMMSLLEPIMIVSVGTIVLVVVLALYMPIFSRAG